LTNTIGKVALLWRGDRQTRDTATPSNNRLHRIFEELAAAGLVVEPCVYDESLVDEVHSQLLNVNCVLVWVNPIDDGKTRKALDSLLRSVAKCGVWVSSHPDVILKMGTKRVLYDTKQLGWGTDVRLYESMATFPEEFAECVRSSGARVLKQYRGNAGNGVWRVELLSLPSDRDAIVRVLHAVRGSVPEDLPLEAFLRRCEAYFEHDGLIVDQPYQARLPDGMIRCYMGLDKVIGYGHQLIKALVPPPPGGPDSPQAQPGPRIMHGPDAPAFQALRKKMETEWVPQMMRILEIERASLPIIWDADFLYGPRDSAGADTYVLCEINVSSVFPIPDEAPAAIARLVRQHFSHQVHPA
jgi:hypothetical protein